MKQVDPSKVVTAGLTDNELQNFHGFATRISPEALYSSMIDLLRQSRDELATARLEVARLSQEAYDTSLALWRERDEKRVLEQKLALCVESKTPTVEVPADQR